MQYYRLDETAGTVANDSSGSGANGAFVGTPGTDYVLGQSPGPITQEPQGWLRNEPTTDSHGVLAPGVPGASNTSSWTLEAWLELSSMPHQYGTIAGSGYMNRLLIGQSGRLLYQGPGRSSLTSATVLKPGVIYHVVLKSDLAVGANGTVSMTINGVKDPNTLAYPSATGRQGFTSNYYWGQYDASTNYKFSGYLGRVAYYTTALADSVIAAHYSAGISVPATPDALTDGDPGADLDSDGTAAAAPAIDPDTCGFRHSGAHDPHALERELFQRAGCFGAK